MRASSRSDARGFAIAWAGEFVLLIVVGAFAISAASRESVQAVARASAGQAYLDLCFSALAEAILTVRASADANRPLAGLDLHEALGAEWPFDRDRQGRPIAVAPIAVPLTAKLARDLHGGAVTVSPVQIACGARMNAGDANPLVGTIQLVARARGRLRGVSTGREVRHVYPFTIPCKVTLLGSGAGEYASVAFGKPALFTQRAGAVVTRP